jgi:hypothetical protein
MERVLYQVARMVSAGCGIDGVSDGAAIPLGSLKAFYTPSLLTQFLQLPHDD